VFLVVVLVLGLGSVLGEMSWCANIDSFFAQCSLCFSSFVFLVWFWEECLICDRTGVSISLTQKLCRWLVHRHNQAD